ncbi:3-oxoadipate enol-lactonase [Desulfosarcina ovata subsp. sediminis]|uniref:3-oxoadipate enol-lactonase n=2 Tax=Desulfosarcina ovata TaxID=83564 RepID=A0A5K7ZM54_9BACT|nr:3-oxoadipate enol-lactonase [Desulfosarcina ovata subsp. sediminis]
MNYEMAGSGKYFTLIHGAGDNLNAWYNQVPVFSQHYNVLTYDVRGHGQTELPEGKVATELWVDDLFALLNALNIRQTFLLGHSMGGAIALRFTLAYPEMVNALILSNSVGLNSMSHRELLSLEDYRNTQIEAIKKKGMGAVFQERYRHMFSPGFIEKNPEIAEHYKSILLKNDPHGYIRVLNGLGSTHKTSDLSIITCPTLIISGEYDLFLGLSIGKIAQKSIRDSQLQVFPTGHAPALEQPSEYNDTVLKFLAGAAH